MENIKLICSVCNGKIEIINGEYVCQHCGRKKTPQKTIDMDDEHKDKTVLLG